MFFLQIYGPYERTPMEDGKCAIQFVRSKAEEWGDPQRIATAGGWVGGHLALWNALKGDLSDPQSDDPIARYSSATLGFIGYVTRVSKDQRFYVEIFKR